MNKKIKLKIIRLGKIIFKTLYKIGIATAGATALTNPVSATIAGGCVLASVVSSSVKDKNIKPIMKIVNTLAVNFDKAENDKKTNQ